MLLFVFVHCSITQSKSESVHNKNFIAAEKEKKSILKQNIYDSQTTKERERSHKDNVVKHTHTFTSTLSRSLSLSIYFFIYVVFRVCCAHQYAVETSQTIVDRIISKTCAMFYCSISVSFYFFQFLVMNIKLFERWPFIHLFIIKYWVGKFTSKNPRSVNCSIVIHCFNVCFISSLLLKLCANYWI